MSFQSILINPIQIGAKITGQYAWWVPIGGLDPNGLPALLKVDSSGNLKIVPAAAAPNTSVTASPTRFQNLGANATLNVKATAGNVFSLTCYNANAASRYIQLHNSATTSSGAPLYSFLVPTGSMTIIGTDFFTNNGANFSTGIAFGFSTTRDTYTAGTAADQSTVIHYA